MEFGRLPKRTLNRVDFRLPKDPPFNKSVLKGTAAQKVRFYFGCAKWGRKEWVGKIYPPKTPEKDFLKHYVGHYNSIELNATHYRLFGQEVIREWGEHAVGKDFLFCPKMYKGITHFGRLESKASLTNDFLRGISALGKHLGPVFVQLGDNFSPKRKQELFDYLATLPRDLQFFVEVRQPDWFEAETLKELCKHLKKLKMGIVITDTAGRRDCAHMHLTIPKTFIRYVGNSLHPTDYTRCDDWVRRIRSWLKQGLKEVYFFMHMHDEATSPELSVYLVDRLNRIPEVRLPRPRLQLLVGSR